MFLEDELLKIAAEYEIESGNDLNELNKVLFKRCVDYYQGKLCTYMMKEEVKILLDKTFNLWDSFVNNMIKHENKKLNILADLFKDHSFRKQFMSHPAHGQFYNSLI